jgi:hypothetical protein
MGLFFKKRLKKGMPISTEGLATALMEIDKALSEIGIAGGYVDWQNKVPLLVPTGFDSTPPPPPSGTGSWQEVGVLTRATSSDPWEISTRYVWCTDATGTDQETVPHVCPEVT